MKSPLHHQGCHACHYCCAPLPRRHEHDHFPIPRSAGGTETVAACMNCHELKDRTPFYKWPINGATEGIQSIIAVGLVRIRPEEIGVEELAAELQRNWDALSPNGRLLLAKNIQARYELGRPSRPRRQAREDAEPSVAVERDLVRVDGHEEEVTLEEVQAVIACVAPGSLLVPTVDPAVPRARGRMGGRPHSLTPVQRKAVRALWDKREHTYDELAQMFKVSRSTIARTVRESALTGEVTG